MGKRILSAILTWCLILTLLPGEVLATELEYSDVELSQDQENEDSLYADDFQALTGGRSGDGLTWKIDASGKLTISGAGDMPDFGMGADNDAPWRGYKINTVQLGNQVTSIGEFAFYGCGIKSITIPSSVTKIGACAFIANTQLTKITIPNSVTSIGTNAFFDCDNLEKIVIPASVTYMGSVEYTGGTFGGIGLGEKIKTAGPIGGNYNYEFGWTSIIPASAFASTCLESVVLPDSITTIGNGAFSGCNYLPSINLPSSLISIGRSAFDDCFSLDNIDIPDGVRFIGDLAFSECESLAQVNIPESVTSIGKEAFAYCYNLSEINIPGNVASVGEGIFYCCENLEKVSISEGVPLISKDMFRSCSNLTDITIPNSVTSIGAQAFEGCRNLTRIIIPASVTSIDYWAFDECGADAADEFTIYCYKDSCAHQYAQDWGIKYVLLDEAVVHAITFDSQGGSAIPGQSVIDGMEVVEPVTPAKEGYTFQGWYTDVACIQLYNFNSPVNSSFTLYAKWEEDIPDNPIALIAVTPTELTLKVGEVAVLTVTTTPENVQYTLSSSDSDIVSVSGNTLTAQKIGQAEITATLVNQPETHAACTVTVNSIYYDDDEMLAIAASQLAYEDELLHSLNREVPVFAEAVIAAKPMAKRELWEDDYVITKVDLYKQVLDGWKIINASSYSSGLFAVALESLAGDRRIIAFRGTEREHLNDIIADIEFAALNIIPKQLKDAMDFYEKNSGSWQEILLTGHSLGGAAACYVSLMTGEHAELFNSANGLIMEDAYLVGVEDIHQNEDIYKNFHGADRWNFVNHVTECSKISMNWPIAMQNAEILPTEIHKFSDNVISGSANLGIGHELCSMIEYSSLAKIFRITARSPYNTALPEVRQFEMARAGIDRLYFHFGSSGPNRIVDKRLIKQVFLLGGDGDDTLISDCINDVLAGGSGVNVMDGGPMNDRYVITGTDDQTIDDCSGSDTIFIPSGVRVSSYTPPVDEHDQFYVFILSNGQKIMLNKNRKKNSSIKVESMDGTDCGTYRITDEQTSLQMMARDSAGLEVDEAYEGHVTTLEFFGKDLTLDIYDQTGNLIGIVQTSSIQFPRYEPYGYFYYDAQENRLWMHLFGANGQIRVSSSTQQAISCTSISHAVDDDLPLRLATAEITLHPAEILLTPFGSMQESVVPFRIEKINGDIQEVPTKIKNLTETSEADHEHNWATVWSNDATHHWRECTVENCPITSNSAKSSYGLHTYEDDTDTTCNDCDYVRTITPQTYSLTVINGTGSGNYEAGVQVSIVANAAPGGKEFDQWATDDGGDFADEFSSNTTFIMPVGNVAIIATYKDISPDSDGKTVVNIINVSTSSDLTYTGSPQQGYTGTPASAYTGDYDILYTGRNSTEYNNTTPPTDAGDYSVTIKVPDSDATYVGSIALNFAIAKATQDAPATPEISSKTSTSVSLKAVEANSNGATAEYSKDGGATWQSSPTFTGLSPNTEYSFIVRYSETKNYSASAVSAALKVQTSSSSSTTTPTTPSVPGYNPGSTYVPPTYSITTPSVTGGKISVSPTSASSGSTVTIATTPDTGYELAFLAVSDTNGKTIDITDKGNGQYSFKMPNSRVSIDAEFKPVSIDVPWNNPFVDVSIGDWYYDAVKFVNQNGLMNGVGNGLFAPNVQLSRAMLAEMLYNKEGRPTVIGGSTFADVQPGAWYADAVVWASGKGIVTGYGNGLFGPDDGITREQVAVMLYRYTGSPVPPNLLLNFIDAYKVSDWAQDAVRWAVDQGILNGKGDGILDPTGKATRAEAAQMLKNYLEK